MKTRLLPGKHKVSLRYADGPAPIDLRHVSRIIPLPAHGAEDVISDGRGAVLCGTNDGSVYRIHTDSGRADLLFNTNGRPLGLELTRDGSLLVCDSFAGLLRYVPTEDGHFHPEPEVLATHVNGQPLKFCSNASEAPDGTIWFTESTSRFHFPEFMGAILEHSATGSLNKRNPDGSIEQVVVGRYFANGVYAEESRCSVVFCETTDYAVRQLDINSGRIVDVEKNLPGFPDNMSTLDADGGVWVAYAHPRKWALDLLAKLPGIIRHIAWALPDAIRPGPKHDTWIVRFDQDQAGKWSLGRQIRGHHPQFHTATGAVTVGDEVIIASKDHNCLLAIDLKAIS